MLELRLIFLVGAVLGSALMFKAAEPARADTAAPPNPPPDPVTDEFAPCSTGSDPAARAVACTGLIVGGTLSGKLLGAAYVFRGKAQAARNEFKAAIDDFTEALKIDFQATDALFDRGVTYAAIGRDDFALADFARLLKIAPNDPYTLIHRARVFARQGKTETAVADLSKVLERAPTDLETRSQRAGLLIELGRYEDAIGDLTVIVKAEPEFAEAAYNRGRAEMLKGDDAAAAKDFDAALRNRAGNPYAALRLYIARARSGKADPAPLNATAKAYSGDQWPMPIVAYYLGQLDETGLRAAAKVGDPASAANLAAEIEYYLGQQALLANDLASARKHFKAARNANAASSDLEFIDAGLELKRLAK